MSEKLSRDRQSNEFKLRERVKELKCLYAISKIGWAVNATLEQIMKRSLAVLPPAMQHPDLAEARISLDSLLFITHRFNKTRHRLSVPFIIEGVDRGVIEVGYRHSEKIRKTPFLKEEVKLLQTVSRELAIVVKRHEVEREKKLLQRQLEHSGRLAYIGELTAGVAHELNEPLGRILGFAQLVKQNKSLDKQGREDSERIIKASLFTREVIKKLMIFSRSMPQRMSFVDINAIVADVFYFMDLRYKKEKVRMIQRLGKNLPIIPGDPVQISQVLVNLITNGIQALGPKGGQVVVSTSKNDRSVVLSVKDNGSGMTDEVKEKIFEPFFTTKEVGKGTGLGLSVVHGIVTAHGGSIKVKTAYGKGTRFDIVFPISKKQKRS